MIYRSFDTGSYKKAASLYSEGFPSDFDYAAWLADEDNIMFVSGEDVGLLAYEYPGMYNGHWFFVSRGRKAKEVATAMIDDLFTNYDASAVRGLTDVKLRGAIWLARQIGFVSMGIVEYDDGPHELLCLTKQMFYDRIKNG